MADEGNGILQKRDACDDFRADIRMQFHDLPFVFAQWTWFVQDRIADTDLADVVQKRSAFQYF